MADPRPIGVFDSGIGGISVLSELLRQHPGERFVYLADSREAPYGTKPLPWVEQRADLMIGQLVDRGVKLVVVACNTASVAALPLLRRHYEVPFVGVEPAVKPAAERSTLHRIGILATPATTGSASLASLIARYGQGVHVIKRECPELVPLIERGIVDGPVMEGLLRGYLGPMTDAGVDVVVLGCTHYRFLQPVIERICGSGVRLVDSAVGVARQTGHLLEEHGLVGDGEGGPVLYLTTGELGEFKRVLGRLAQMLGGLPELRDFGVLASPPALVSVTSL